MGKTDVSRNALRPQPHGVGWRQQEEAKGRALWRTGELCLWEQWIPGWGCTRALSGLVQLQRLWGVWAGAAGESLVAEPGLLGLGPVPRGSPSHVPWHTESLLGKPAPKSQGHLEIVASWRVMPKEKKWSPRAPLPDPKTPPREDAGGLRLPKRSRQLGLERVQR